MRLIIFLSLFYSQCVLATYSSQVVITDVTTDDTASVGADGSVKVDNSSHTQPISALALPLPSGAATESTLSTVNTTLGSPFQAGGSIANTAFGISGTLPAFASTPTVNLGTLNGAATDASLLTINTTLGSPFQAGGSIGNSSFGISGTLPAFAATPTVNLGTATTGRMSIALVRNVYSSVNVTTAAYVELIASTSNTINYLDIFDSSGQTLALAVGGAGSEVNQLYVVPGGNGPVPLLIPSGSRVSIKAVSATANSGELDITFYK
jgi:hypothetical protein